MFSKLSTAVTSVLILDPCCRHPNTPPPVTPPTSSQCCNSVVPASSSAASAIAGLLGLDITGLAVDVGLSCSPITVAGNSCASETVICDAPEIEWGGLLAINCIPVTL
ncbi:hydrophobin-3 [Mycena vulgaris]|nr:hydrophobin-3 [Mycena vulgaris]